MHVLSSQNIRARARNTIFSKNGTKLLQLRRSLIAELLSALLAGCGGGLSAVALVRLTPGSLNLRPCRQLGQNMGSIRADPLTNPKAGSAELSNRVGKSTNRPIRNHEAEAHTKYAADGIARDVDMDTTDEFFINFSVIYSAQIIFKRNIQWYKKIFLNSQMYFINYY